MLCQVRIVARARTWLLGTSSDTLHARRLLLERDPQHQGLDVLVNASLHALRELDIDFMIMWAGMDGCSVYLRPEDVEAVRLLSEWLQEAVVQRRAITKHLLQPADLNAEAIQSREWLRLIGAL